MVVNACCMSLQPDFRSVKPTIISLRVKYKVSVLYFCEYYFKDEQKAESTGGENEKDDSNEVCLSTRISDTHSPGDNL